jgi:hypothetical protein
MKDLKHNYPLIFAVFVILAIIGFSFDSNLLEEKPRNEKPAKVEPRSINLPNVNHDFTTDNQGTITFQTNLNIAAMLVDGKNPEYIVFFESKNIEGLKIRYNVKDKTFEAGLPVMKSSPITFGNGEVHTMRYTYVKDLRQELVFDNNLIAAGYYDGISKMNKLTGFSIFLGNEEVVAISNLHIK